jgi:hypothetical protein
MRHCFETGARVRLTEAARRVARKALRTGIVICPSRSGTQYQVKWDDVTWPQLIHANLLELAEAETESGQANTVAEADDSGTTPCRPEVEEPV